MSNQLVQRIRNRIQQHGQTQQIEQLCLDDLKIHSFNITICQQISRCTNVLYLTLNHCEITSLEHFPSIFSVIALELVGNQIPGEEIHHINNCPKIQHLALDQNLICTVEELAPLSELQQIEHLELRGNPICLIQSYRDRIFQTIPSLKIVDGHDAFGDQDVMYGTQTESNNSQANQNDEQSSQEEEYEQNEYGRSIRKFRNQ